MAKFHISKKGVPAPCKAEKGKCPLGGEENHFNSYDEAQEYIDKINESQFGVLPPIVENDEDSIEVDSKSSVDLEINAIESTEERKEKEKRMIEGIFSHQTRRFGNAAEMIIRKKYGLSEKTKDQHHDATDSNGNRIEIKFSRGLKEDKEKLTEDNFLDKAIYSSMHHRALSHDNYHGQPFDSNIQQVKVSEFDELYYGIFFIDKIAVFKVKSEDVKNIEGYSDFQHKGNEGEGQFHLNTNSIDYHMDNYFLEWIEYSEVYEMFPKSDTSDK